MVTAGIRRGRLAGTMPVTGRTGLAAGYFSCLAEYLGLAVRPVTGIVPARRPLRIPAVTMRLTTVLISGRLQLRNQYCPFSRARLYADHRRRAIQANSRQHRRGDKC